MDAAKQRTAAAIKLLKLAGDATKQGNLSLAYNALQRCLGTTSNDKVQARALFRLGQLQSRMGDPDSAALCFFGAAQRDNSLSAPCFANMHLCVSKVVPISTLMTVVNDVRHSKLLQNAVEQALVSSMAHMPAGADATCEEEGAEYAAPAVLAIGEHSGWVLGLSAIRALTQIGAAHAVASGATQAAPVNQVLCVVGSDVVKEMGNMIARSNDINTSATRSSSSGL